MIWDTIDKANFPHNLLLNNAQVSKIRQAFPNCSMANIKFSKIDLSKAAQLGEGFQANVLHL